MSTRTVLPLVGLALAGGLAVSPSLAQPAAAPPTPAGPPPPTLVGRLALLQGTVSFHPAGSTEWQTATLNYPVTSGNAFWTQPGALAEIEEASSQVWMNASTELDVTTLDTQTFAVTEPEGEAFLHLAVLQGQTVTIETPRGIVTIAAAGEYDVIAGDTQQPTEISVVTGSAQIAANTTVISVAAHQTATITGAQTFQASIGALQQTPFMTQVEQRERPVVSAVQASAPPPVVTQMTGGEELSEYGAWQPNPQYGEVWYPQVAQGWAPYHDGRWVYQAPWGWTWVSAEPWGFAPFHYGRWADIGGRWGWVPGRYEQGPPQPPVYAPALVSFFGLGVGAGRQIGWVPLAPGQAYYPPYRHDPSYLREINRWNVRNAAALPAEPPPSHGLAQFPNRGAAFAVPAGVMARSQPVRAAAQRLPAERLGQAQPLTGRHPVTPAAVAMAPGHAAPGPRAAAPAHAGPGGHTLPGLRPATAAAGRPAGREPEAGAAAAAHGAALPALRGPNARPGAEPGQAAHRPGEPAVAPGSEHAVGLPALRAPGARPGEPGTRAPGEAHPGAAAIARPETGHAVEPAQHGAPAAGHVEAPVAHGEPARGHAETPVPHAAPAARRPEVVAPRAEPAVRRPEAPAPHAAPAERRPEAPAPHAAPAERHPEAPAPHAAPAERRPEAPAAHPGPAARRPEAPRPRSAARPAPAPHRAPPPGRRAAPAPHRPAPERRAGPAPHGLAPRHAGGPAPHGRPAPHRG